MRSNRGRGRRNRNQQDQQPNQIPGAYNGEERIVLTHHSLRGGQARDERRGSSNSNRGSNNQRGRGRGYFRQRSRKPKGPIGPMAAPGELDGFELFCAYHLGLSPDGQYRQQNINDIARRYGKVPAEIKQLLVDFGIDSDTIINTEFDLGLAQLDIMVAPEGINKRELAKGIYEEFMNAPKKQRNWNKELAEDAEENKKTFGK